MSDATQIATAQAEAQTSTTETTADAAVEIARIKFFSPDNLCVGPKNSVLVLIL